MIRSYNGKTPQIAPTAFVSEAAYVVGDVTIGEGSSVWPGAVVRADFAPIRIGRHTHIEDNCTIHEGNPIDIGDHVTIGHNSVVHCRRVGNNTLIGIHATLLNGAEIGDECVVAAGAVVMAGAKIPDRSFVVGLPAEVRPLTEDQYQRTRFYASTYTQLAAQYLAEGLGSSGPAAQ